MIGQAATEAGTGTGGERREGAAGAPPTISPAIRSTPVPVGCIYVVEAEGLGLVKIGMAVDVAARMRSLQNMSPARLIVLAAFYAECATVAECALHQRFRADRRHGEWFAATPEITDWAWHDSPTGQAHRKRAQAAADAVWKRRG